MRADYTRVFQDAEAVEKYEHVVYAPDSYASAINHRQRAYLRRLVRRAFPDRRPVQHDFACGTGRAIRILHGVVRAAHGYDTSAEMLAKAAEVGAYARLHQVSASGPVPTPSPTAGPAIVTVFRLLLNSSEDVRDRAIAFAARALPHYGSGLLVVENHGNRRSLRHSRHRRHAGEPWFAELSHAEVTALLARHGFMVVGRQGFTLLPRGWYGRAWMRPLARIIDELTCRIPPLSEYAVNVLYVARRVEGRQRPETPPAHPDATSW
jgi:predicted TPR repeat methyltransferase